MLGESIDTDGPSRVRLVIALTIAAFVAGNGLLQALFLAFPPTRRHWARAFVVSFCPRARPGGDRCAVRAMIHAAEETWWAVLAPHGLCHPGAPARCRSTQGAGGTSRQADPAFLSREQEIQRRGRQIACPGCPAAPWRREGGRRNSRSSGFPRRGGDATNSDRPRSSGAGRRRRVDVARASILSVTLNGRAGRAPAAASSPSRARVGAARCGERLRV